MPNCQVFFAPAVFGRARLFIQRLCFAALGALFLGACASPSLSFEKYQEDSASPLPKTPEGMGQACTALPACPVCPACPQETPPSAEPAVRLEAAAWRDLPDWRQDQFSAAWGAFKESCRVLRKPKSGVRPQDNPWGKICGEADNLLQTDENTLRHFFERHFVPHAVIEDENRREGLVTGYFEPLIAGSLEKSGEYAVPVLAAPPDMLNIELGELFPDLKYRRLRGRLEGGKVLPYWSRPEIEALFEKGQWKGQVLLWARDAVEFFFLQIQGSGRVQLPDGGIVRIGYADQNGHPYRSIGRLLIERGELKAEEASMQGIQAWGLANPDALRELLNNNPSYVFFRETAFFPASRKAGALPDQGPIGALGVPLTPKRSIAIDPRHIPLGAPVWISTTYPNSATPLNQLVMAQDTGGAIKGGIRADFFWGAGREAGEKAGRMKQQGRMWVLLPARRP